MKGILVGGAEILRRCAVQVLVPEGSGTERWQGDVQPGLNAGGLSAQHWVQHLC